MNKNNELNCEECKKRIVFFQIDKNKEFSERFQCLNTDSGRVLSKTLFFNDTGLEKDLIQAHTIILNSSYQIKQMRIYNDFYCENSRSYQSINEILLVSLIIFVIFTVICLVCCKIPHLSPFVCKYIFICSLNFLLNTTLVIFDQYNYSSTDLFKVLPKMLLKLLRVFSKKFLP